MAPVDASNPYGWEITPSKVDKATELQLFSCSPNKGNKGQPCEVNTQLFVEDWGVRVWMELDDFQITLTYDTVNKQDYYEWLEEKEGLLAECAECLGYSERLPLLLIVFRRMLVPLNERAKPVLKPVGPPAYEPPPPPPPAPKKGARSTTQRPNPKSPQPPPKLSPDEDLFG